MSLEPRYLVLTFDSTHEAIDAEKRFRAELIPLELIPVPSRIDSSCGLDRSQFGRWHDRSWFHERLRRCRYSADSDVAGCGNAVHREASPPADDDTGV